MTDQYVSASTVYFTLAASGLLMCGLTFLFMRIAYKDGQIDAMNGDVKYHLVHRRGNVWVWRRIKP